jgi:hypothetical protein
MSGMKTHRFSIEAASLGGSRGGPARKATAKTALIDGILSGNPSRSARAAINRWAKEDGISAVQWCENAGIEMPPAQDNTQTPSNITRSPDYHRQNGLERTVSDACRMLGVDGRWVVIALLEAGGLLPSPKGFFPSNITSKETT